MAVFQIYFSDMEINRAAVAEHQFIRKCSELRKQHPIRRPLPHMLLLRRRKLCRFAAVKSLRNHLAFPYDRALYQVGIAEQLAYFLGITVGFHTEPLYRSIIIVPVDVVAKKVTELFISRKIADGGKANCRFGDIFFGIEVMRKFRYREVECGHIRIKHAGTAAVCGIIAPAHRFKFIKK